MSDPAAPVQTEISPLQNGLQSVRDIPISGVRAISERIAKVSKQRPVYNGTLGEPTHAMPEGTAEAMQQHVEAFKGKAIGYGSMYGEPECRARLAAVMNKEYTAHSGAVPGFTADNLLMTVGASSGLQAAMIVLADKTAPVLTPVPYYLLYKQQAEFVGADLIPMDVSTSHYKITPEVLEAHLSAVARKQGVEPAEVRANVLFDYPGNPIGTMLNTGEWQGVAEVLRKYPKVNIMLDEIYRDIIVAQDEQGNPKPYVSLLHVAPDLLSRTVMFHSGSKGAAIAGSRIGFAVAPKEIRDKMATAQFPIVVHPTRSAQAGLAHAMEVISASPAEKKRISDYYKQRIDIVRQGLGPASIDANIEGALYVVGDLKSMIGMKFSDAARAEVRANPQDFPGLDTPTIQNDKQIALHLLYEHGAAVTPGSGFGYAPEDGKVRIACSASPEQLRGLTEAINAALSQAKASRLEAQKPWLNRVVDTVGTAISSVVGF